MTTLTTTLLDLRTDTRQYLDQDDPLDKYTNAELNRHINQSISNLFTICSASGKNIFASTTTATCTSGVCSLTTAAPLSILDVKEVQGSRRLPLKRVRMMDAQTLATGTQTIQITYIPKPTVLVSDSDVVVYPNAGHTGLFDRWVAADAAKNALVKDWRSNGQPDAMLMEILGKLDAQLAALTQIPNSVSYTYGAFNGSSQYGWVRLNDNEIQLFQV